MAGFLRSSQPLAASTPPNHSRRIRTPQPHGVAPKTSPEPRPLRHSGSASLSVFCNGDIGAIDPNCNDYAAANVGAAKSPSVAPKFEANVELGMLHADRNPKAMRQNRCSNLSAVIASPYEMRADHEGRRRDLFLSGPIFCFFRNSALYSLGCLTSEKSMTPGRTLRTGPARRVDPCNPLKTLKTNENIFGEIWRSLQIPCNYLLWDSIKSKA